MESPMSEEEPKKAPRKPTLTLAMIARDRSAGLRRVLESVRDYVDEIIVVDAGGSVDDTVQVAQGFGARVLAYNPTTNPEGFYLDSEAEFAPQGVPGPFTNLQALADFSVPRNLAFDAANGDYILWLDSDDVLVGAEHLPTVVAQMQERGISAAFFEYEYDHDERGNCILRQIRERIIKRGTGRWEQPIHELIVGHTKGILFTEIKVVHERKVLVRTESHAAGLIVGVEHRDIVCFRNVKNLLVYKKAMEAAGKQWPFRFWFYLGTEMRAIDADRAVPSLQAYIKETPWDEERAAARFCIGQIREAQLRGEEAWDYFAGSVLDFPGNPSAWFGLARIALVRGNWKSVIEYTEKGLSMVGGKEQQAKNPSLVLSPIEWSYRALLPYTRALIEFGRFEEARKHCEAGLKAVPGCKFLLAHLEMIQEKVEMTQENATESTAPAPEKTLAA